MGSVGNPRRRTRMQNFNTGNSGFIAAPSSTVGKIKVGFCFIVQQKAWVVDSPDLPQSLHLVCQSG